MKILIQLLNIFILFYIFYGECIFFFYNFYIYEYFRLLIQSLNILIILYRECVFFFIFFYNFTFISTLDSDKEYEISKTKESCHVSLFGESQPRDFLDPHQI